MSAAVLAALAAGAALGLLLVVAGLTGRSVISAAGEGPATRLLKGPGIARVAACVAAFVVVVGVTGWIVGGVLAGVAVVALPRVLGGKAARQRAIDRTEAVASWTEMVRDSIVAASGLEEAIVATAPVAPAPIAREVRALVRRLDHQRLPDALVALGNDLDHPSGDLVVAALVIASRLEASDLSSLLSRLADATRGEARMRIRVEVGRTRVRTATKVIIGVVVAAVAFLALVNRDYLAVYDSPTGQLVLAVVGGIFATGGWLLARMSEIELPERFTARAVGPSIDGVES
jgi:Flp pilus assembly protein TadB